MYGYMSYSSIVGSPLGMRDRLPFLEEDDTAAVFFRSVAMPASTKVILLVLFLFCDCCCKHSTEAWRMGLGALLRELAAAFIRNLASMEDSRCGCGDDDALQYRRRHNRRSSPTHVGDVQGLLATHFLEE